MEEDCLRPLKTGLVLNSGLITVSVGAYGLSPSPKNGVSFKHKKELTKETSKILSPSPKNGVSFKH